MRLRFVRDCDSARIEELSGLQEDLGRDGSVIMKSGLLVVVVVER